MKVFQLCIITSESGLEWEIERYLIERKRSVMDYLPCDLFLYGFSVGLGKQVEQCATEVVGVTVRVS